MPEAEQATNIIAIDSGKTDVKFSRGTSVFTGIFKEEFLTTLRGNKAADVYDQMRRGDGQIKMVINAVLNTLRSATYTIEPYTNDAEDPFYEEAQRQAEFASFQIFDDLASSWQDIINEIYTFPIFGYSPHVMVDKHVTGHKQWGSYTGLHDIVYLSQKSIHAWQLDPYGNLLSIEQRISGDLAAYEKIPADFLLVFTCEREGANYEGISILRAAYGSWFRKNTYLKIQGIGIERTSLGIPCMKVPTGKEGDPEKDRAASMMEALAAHQLQWMLIPQGWDFDVKQVAFNAEAVLKAIDQEDQAMARTVLANFLNLGQGSAGGAYSLSDDLSDFFLAGNQYLANIVTNTFNRRVIPRLIKLNWGDQPGYPYMKVSNLKDKAGKEFAEITQILKSSGALGVWSKQDVAHMRERIGWIEENEDDPAQGQPQPAQPFGADPRFTVEPDPKPSPEPKAKPKKKPDDDVKLSQTVTFARSGAKAVTLIEKGAESLKDVFRSNVRFITEKLITDLVETWERLPENQKPKAIDKVTPGGVVQFKTDLRNAMFNLSTKALNQVAVENPKIDGTKLAQFADPAGINGKPPKKRDIAKLPKKMKSTIEIQSSLIAETLVGDIEKQVFFVFGSMSPVTDSPSRLQQELSQPIDKLLAQAETAAFVTSAKMVNETRHHFFYAPEVWDQIGGFQFYNEDPVTAICTWLNGKVFLKKDAATSFEYEPPLHFNCKSCLVAIEAEADDELAEAEKGGVVPPKSLQENGEIQLDEKCCAGHDLPEQFVRLMTKSWATKEDHNAA